MNTKEAIKQLEDALADKWCPWGPELKAAIRLGIEALKRIQEGRPMTFINVALPLPGETED